MANFGYSFAPTASMQQPGAQAATQPPSRAVEIKSLNLPQREVPGQIAPSALLAAPGGGGVPTAQLLQMLMAAFAPQSQQSAGVPYLPSAVGTPTQTPTSGISGGAGSPFQQASSSQPSASPAASGPSPMPSAGPRVAFGDSVAPKANPITINLPGADNSAGQPVSGAPRLGTHIEFQSHQNGPIAGMPVTQPTSHGPLIDNGPIGYPVTPYANSGTPQGFDLSSLIPSYKLGGFASY